ncbi:hypothetical protein SAMN05443377_11255 [Propionibacterium cyclohexanicum]|uniref:Uncharacterized protein n=1 Tax=Propionibacterium cyclohexanicum TaxID=64702 RepID=A0A1H9SBS0_9ACTN|nr:hypothetical protein [Propionibacterium cyclohexanicum]SER82486.1 hypothetical protein SAMN05443377_11255 [Propionibacterium cyclohexanicum]
MSGIDINLIRAQFAAPQGTGRERAQTELILRMCDEIERLWSEAQWHDLRGAVVGGMASGMMERNEATIDALDLAGRRLAHELVVEMRRCQRCRDSLALAEIAAGESASVFVVGDLGVPHLGRQIVVDGRERGTLRALSQASRHPDVEHEDAAPVEAASSGHRVHLMTDTGEFDVDAMVSCMLVPPTSDQS